MDVGFYISELLEQRGEVNVPGLGHLIQTRVSGYYNAADFKFYPPHNEVKFDPNRLNEGHALTQYIADKKNISLESSQYFTEKYVANLKEDALYNDVPIANIGWFYNDGGSLAFKTNKISNDPVFYGYPAVRANKLLSQITNSAAVAASTDTTDPEPAATPTPVTEPVAEPQPAAPTYPLETESIADAIEEQQEPEEELYEEPRSNKALKALLYILGTIIVLLIIGYALYIYKPSAFERIESYMGRKNTPAKLEEANTIKADTTATLPDTTVHIDSAVKADTVINTNTPTATITNKISQTEVTKTTVVTTPANRPPGAPITTPKVIAPKVRQFGIILYSATSMAQANSTVNNYRANGVDANIVAGTKAPKIKISSGTFKSYDEAKVAMTKLIKSGKIGEDAYPTELK